MSTRKLKKVLFMPLIGLLLITTLSGFINLDDQVLAGTIHGVVSSPGGYPLPQGTLVKLFEPGTENLRGAAQPDLDTGNFTIGPVPHGLYVVKAVPPVSSEYTQSLPKAVSITNNPVNVGVLALTDPQVYGTVVAPDGFTPVEAEVRVHLGDGHIFQVTATSGGSFTLGGLPNGGYWLQAIPVNDDPFWKSPPISLNIPNQAITQTVTLPLRPADLWGTIRDGLGNPIKDAVVIAANQSGFHQSDRSNANGFWAIGGLPHSEIVLTARPPWPDSGLLPPEPVTVTIPTPSNPYDLVFSSPVKVITGNVLTNAGLPVDQARILARRLNRPGRSSTLSLDDGSYELQLASGLWSLTVEPVSSTVPADWVYPLPPQLVYFHPDNTAESAQQDFKVYLADATVIGEIQLPDGSPPPFTVTVALHSTEGVGLRTNVDPGTSSFSLDVPGGGYKVLVHPHDERYLSPAIEPITVQSGETLDMGVISLLPRDATITGTITTQVATESLADGDGLQGIPVVAWRPGLPGSIRTTSGPGGAYSLMASAGTWHIQPAPEASQPYIFTSEGFDLDLTAGSTTGEINFTLLPADASITGVLVSPDGMPVVDADGWAIARDASNNIQRGAPIQAGTFTLLVPAGDYQIAAHLPAGSPYMSTGDRSVSVAPASSQTITLTVKEKDAAIAGALYDPRNNDIVSGLKGFVAAWDPTNWAATPINAGNGSYHLEVATGLWHLNYKIAPDGGYTKGTGVRNIPVQSGQTAVVPLTVLENDSHISGTVLAPDGSPLSGATVYARGLSGAVNGIWQRTSSTSDGSFSISLPYGSYSLGATYSNPDWIKPIETRITLEPAGTSDGHILQFQQPDAVITGTLTVTNTQNAGEVLVWAWSDDGGFTKGRFTVTTVPGLAVAQGDYQLSVVSGTTWHIGAAFETSSKYWLGRASIEVTSSTVTQDITLYGPKPKPAPVAITFDTSEPQFIALADGTQIFIPAGALPADGMVTLRIVPIASVPHQGQANVLRYGYAFLATTADGEPIEDHFNQDVAIHFSYDEDELARQHIHESWLKPAYYSTTTDQWTFPESYVIDRDKNSVIMLIDHFTDFALTGSSGYTTYIPMIAR